MDWTFTLSPILLALISTVFTALLTALGAAAVFFFKKIDYTFFDFLYGFTSGVMLAACFWSLLAPAIELSEDSFIPSYATALLGLLGGAVFLSLADRFESSVKKTSEGESMSRIKMMVFAITLHNIPEGLAIGVAFGAITNGDRGELIAAAMLAFGIGIQNIPEGAAVSLPLLKEGKSPWYSFLYGALSGCVEPVSGVIGAALVILMRPILPFALSFAAGAMLYVVVGELIPDATENGATSRKKCVWGTVIGFGIMMALDVALG